MSDYSIYEDDNEYVEIPERMEIEIIPEKIVFSLSPENGEVIKDLIRNIYHHTFPNYCARVGLRPPNFYNVMNGERPCSLVFLNKLLSGINYKVELSNPVLVIQAIEIGRVVNDADLALPEEESQSSVEEVNKDILESSLSEKHQESLKIKQDTHSSESQDQSSKFSSPTSPTNLNTSSQMPWGVDL